MLGFTKDKELIPINEHPSVVTVRARLLAARADLAKWETEEHRLKLILDPPPESSTQVRPDITVQDIREAKQRLRADLGVTVASHFYLSERRAALQVVEDLEVEAARVREQAVEELRAAVKERAAHIAKDLQVAFVPCQELAAELLALQEDSGITVPMVHSCLRFSNVENELRALLDWAKN